jgi:putative cofactor-binding repeat protein
MVHSVGTFAIAQLGSLEIPAWAKVVRTTGYAAEGDAGAALYREVEGWPAPRAGFQDALWRRFELAPGQAITPERFGAVDPARDAAAAIQAALDFAALHGGAVELLRTYLCADGIEVPAGVTLRGTRASGLRRIDQASALLASPLAGGSAIQSFDVDDASGFAVGQSLALAEEGAPRDRRLPVIIGVSGNRITVDPRGAELAPRAAGMPVRTGSRGLLLHPGAVAEGFTVDGNAAGQAAADRASHCELRHGGGGCLVRDVDFRDVPAGAVEVAGGDGEVRLTGCRFSSVAGAALRCDHAGSVAVEACRFRDIGAPAVAVTGAASVLIAVNELANGSIHIEAAAQARIADNLIDNRGGTDEAGIALVDPGHASVEGNRVLGGAYGISIESSLAVAGGLAVSGNHLSGQQAGAVRATAHAGRIEAVVRGNLIRNAAAASAPSYRAVELAPGMVAVSNDIALEVGEPWSGDLLARNRAGNVLGGLPGTAAGVQVASLSGSVYEPALADSNLYLRFDSAGPARLRVPAEAAVPFAVGTRIEVEQAGEGRIGFGAAPGVTLSARGARKASAGCNAVALLTKHGADSWTLSGDLDFRIEALFAGGEKGVLFDCSDAGALFQDEAGTVAASADGGVALMRDRSGNAVDAVQSAAASQPVLREGGGRRWLEFNGTSHIFALPGLVSPASAYTLVAAVDPIQTAQSYLLDIQTGRLIFATRETNIADFVSFYDATVWRRGGATQPGDQVLAWHLAPGAAQVRRNGAALASGLAYTPRTVGGSVRLGGHHGAGPQFFKGRLYALLLIARALDPDELREPERWAAARAGIAL